MLFQRMPFLRKKGNEKPFKYIMGKNNMNILKQYPLTLIDY